MFNGYRPIFALSSSYRVVFVFVQSYFRFRYRFRTKLLLLCENSGKYFVKSVKIGFIFGNYTKNAYLCAEF